MRRLAAGGDQVGEADVGCRVAVTQAGKRVWPIGDGPTLIDRGLSFLCITQPTGFLEATLREKANQLRNWETPIPNR